MRILLAILLLLILTGCAHTPYTDREKTALYNMVIGQLFVDGGTTLAGCNNGCKEINPVYGDGDGEAVVAVKVLAIIALLGIGEIVPEARHHLFWAGAGFGYGAGLANVYTITTVD